MRGLALASGRYIKNFSQYSRSNLFRLNFNPLFPDCLFNVAQSPSPSSAPMSLTGEFSKVLGKSLCEVYSGIAL